MAVLADITKGGRKAEAHRPWPRFTVGTEAWRRAVNALVEARATLLGLWGDKEQVHLALLEEPSAAIAVVTLECPDGKFPSVGASHTPGHPARTRHSRPVRPEAGRRRRHAGVARSRLLGRVAAARRQQEEPKSTTGLRLLARGGRGPAPDPGRAGACRHHRARPFPLHRQRRDGGAAGRAARLCA